MIEKIGGRKFIMWLILTAVSAILLWFGKIQPENWEGVMMWVTVAVMGGNAATHLAQSFKRN